MMNNEKIYTPAEIRNLPKVISLMPPSIANMYNKRYAVYTGDRCKWFLIDKQVTIKDVASIWERWHPKKTQEEKLFETQKFQKWEIPASNNKGTYTVTLELGNFTCSCVGFGFRRKCKHIDEAKKLLNDSIKV